MCKPPADHPRRGDAHNLSACLRIRTSGCHGSSSTTATSTNYTVGGSISGLTVSSVLLANGTATVTVAANATSWVFPTSFVAGSSYSVTVQTQPTGELCEVTSGASGMKHRQCRQCDGECAVTDSGPGKAARIRSMPAGCIGTLGTAAAGNLPGARYWTSSWTDSSGDFWLFGGVGYDATGATGYLNDLWRYTRAPVNGLDRRR